METREKLDIFYSASLDVAYKQSAEIISEYEQAIKSRIEDFAANKKKELDALYHIESGKLKREMNHKMSEAVIERKRELNQVQKEKKDLLFQKVTEMLQDFLATEGYVDYLRAKIQLAKKIAGKEELILYLNASDQSRRQMLQEFEDCTLTISNIDFIGGIRAVIRSKNILIDESFSTKLLQERKEYNF